MSTESVTERGVPRRKRQGVMGTLAAGGGAAWPASSSAVAHRRGPLPAAPMPRTRPQHTPRRNAPWVMRSANWPGRSSRARCAGRRVKDDNSPGRDAAHYPGWPLQRQGHPKIVSNRFAETIFGTHP